MAAVLLLCAGASATIVPQVSFEELTDSSEFIASGRISRSWAAWDSSHKYIWTHYELTVAAAWKGAGRAVEFAEPGGSVGGEATMIAGAVTYAVGDRVVVFLKRMPNGYLRTTGWAQGKYDVDAGGRLHGAAALGGAEIVQSGSGAAGSSLRTLEGMTESELGQRVAARLRISQGQGRAQ